MTGAEFVFFIFRWLVSLNAFRTPAIWFCVNISGETAIDGTRVFVIELKTTKLVRRRKISSGIFLR